jgi:hypothetical protein
MMRMRSSLQRWDNTIANFAIGNFPARKHEVGTKIPTKKERAVMKREQAIEANPFGILLGSFDT